MGAPWEEYAATSAPSAAAPAPWQEYASAPASSGVMGMVKDYFNDDPAKIPARLGNLAAGAVRGAASIGATFLAPYDMTKDALDGKGLSLASNRQRRADIDAGLVSLGADPASLQYQVGKLGAEVAGTAGVGGLLAAPVKALSAAAPVLARVATPIANAIESGGFNVGAKLPLTASIPARAVGGAINGGATAGLVNPDDAGTGAKISAALPAATRAVGAVGSAFRSAAPDLTPQMRASAQSAIDAGYVIPPATLNPSFINKALESVSGKQATQQIASVRNNDTTMGLVRQALGIADDAPVDRAALDAIRKDAGKAYQAVAALPSAAPQQGSGVMNMAPKNAIDPAQMLQDLRQARNDAQSYFNSYNRSANPEHLAVARAADAKANALETGLQDYAASMGRPDLIPALQDARKRIAQTYTVERALNDATGSINASVFGKLYQKGKPLSDGLDTVGQFAAAFPTVAKVPEKIGSPDTHNLKTIASIALGTGGHVAAGPLGVLTATLPWVAPPAARSIMFSQPVQRGLLDTAPVFDPTIAGLLTSGASRVAPLIPAQ